VASWAFKKGLFNSDLKSIFFIKIVLYKKTKILPAKILITVRFLKGATYIKI